MIEKLPAPSLPPLYYGMAAHEQCDERERQLAAALGELSELREQLKTVLDREAASQKRHEERLAALQASHDQLLEGLTFLTDQIASGTLTWYGQWDGYHVHVRRELLDRWSAVIAQAETLKEKP